MAGIATLLCWLFIAVLLVRDCKRRKSVSAAVWIPMLMVLAFSSRTPAGWLSNGTYAVTTGPTNEAPRSLVDQTFFATTIAASAIVASMRGVKWIKLLGANITLALFFLYFIVSSLWSAYHADSLIRALKDFGTTVPIVAVILSEKDPVEAVRAVYVRCACILFPLSFLLIRYYGQFGRQYDKSGGVTFTGVATQKNSFGELLMVFSLILIWDHLETRTATAKWPWSGMRIDILVLLVMGIWHLNVSQSKTSLLCFLIGLTLLVSMRWANSRVIGYLLLLTTLCLPFLVLLTNQFSSNMGFVLEALGRDDTFTGRADIWQHITLQTVNPLVGAGYWNFWSGSGGRAIANAIQFDTPNAHNGYLDIYLDGGLIGLFLLACVLITYGRRLIKHLPGNLFSRFRFIFLIVVIIHNLTESSFARPTVNWLTFVLVLIEFPILKGQFRPDAGRSDKAVQLERQRSAVMQKVPTMEKVPTSQLSRCGGQNRRGAQVGGRALAWIKV